MKELRHITSAHKDESMQRCIYVHGPAIYGYFWMILEMIGEEIGRNKQHPVRTLPVRELEDMTKTSMSTGIKYLLTLQEESLLSFSFDSNKENITLVCLNLLKYNYAQIVCDLYEEQRIHQNSNSSVANNLKSLLDIFRSDMMTIDVGKESLKDLEAISRDGKVVNITEMFNVSGDKFTSILSEMEGDTDAALYFYFLYSLKFLLNIYKQMGAQWRFRQIILGDIDSKVQQKEIPTSSIGEYGYGIGMKQPNMLNVNPQDDPQFEEFWALYPRKQAKKKAYDVWVLLKNKKQLPEFSKLLNILKLHINSVSWKQEGGKYIPAPYTWLVDGRWSDDLAALNRVGSLKTQIQSVSIQAKPIEPHTSDIMSDYRETELKRKMLLEQRKSLTVSQ